MRYACRDGYILTQGHLVLACGHDGHFIGQLPVCTGERNDKESACVCVCTSSLDKTK